jgi:hypothetical protein
MTDRLELFLRLSEIATGFNRFQLLATAMADEYLHVLEAIVPAGIIDDLLGTCDQLPKGTQREAEFADKILSDPRLGPVAQRVTVLWYCGAWTALPEAWRASYGASPLDTSRVVSANAYLAGLQWVVAGGHPPGSRQQGFGSWGDAPERSLL